VVTEIRGSGGTYGQWIELLVATEEPIDLRGVQLWLRRPSGGDSVRIVVRETLPAEPGQLVVLGHHEPDEVPEWVDYSFFGDFFATSEDDPTPLGPRDLYPAGVLQVVACGQDVDRVVYPELPAEGTWALDGELPPDDVVNDDVQRWCNDAFDPGVAGEIGLPGTPGAPNRPCSID
jgi:hypothetical protein